MQPSTQARILLFVTVLMALPAILPPVRAGTADENPTAGPTGWQTLNLTASRDAYVVDVYPDRNFGGRLSIVTGRDGNGSTSRGIAGFDLSAIPPYATIANATLRAGPVSTVGSGGLDVYRVRAPWLEGGGIGSTFVRNLTVSEEGNTARTREPVLVHLDVPGGIATDPRADFRVFDPAGNEVPSQVFNVSLSGVKVVGLDLSFGVTIGRLETKTYTVRYGLIPLPAVPAYRTKTFTANPLWTYAGGAVEATPAIGDLNGDGILEVVVGTTAGQVTALRWDGTALSPLWTYAAPGAIVTPIRIADLTGDGTPEVLFETTEPAPPFNNTLTALSRTGQYLWHFPLGGSPTGPFAVADTDGDGIAEIFTSASISNSSFYAIRGSDGSQICQYTDLGSVNSGYGFAVGDTSSAPGPEIVFTDNGGKIRIRGPDCSNVFPSNTKPGVASMAVAPILVNLSFGGLREILVGDLGGGNSREFAVSGLNWSTLAASPFLGSDVTSQLAGDMDRDGKTEVYVLTQDGALHRLSGSLATTPPGWRFPGLANGTAVSLLSAADLTLDGNPEILYGTNGSVAYAVSAQGTEAHRWVVGAPVVAGPLAADLDGDGTLEVVFASDNTTAPSKTAAVYAFGTGSLGYDTRTAGYNVADTGLWLDGNSPDGKPRLRLSLGSARPLDAGVTWLATGAVSPSTWATPGIDIDLSPLASATAVPGGVPSWNLTNLVRGWVNGTLPNNGVALRSANEATTWTVSFPSREGGPGCLVLQVTFAFDPNPRIAGRVPDQVKPEDSPPWTLDLAGFALDADTPLTRLRWNLVGVNATLYQVLGGNVTGGQVLTFRALPDQFGNNLVTLFLFDDQSHFAKQPLWVNLTPVNDPPLFDPPGVFYVRYDTSYAFNFTEDISDVDNDVGSLTLATDDPVHAPVTPPPHWVTFLYPQSFANRWAYVTLTVSDGQASVSRVVAVWVSTNYPPELTKELPDVTLFEHETRVAVFDLDDYFIDRDQNSVFYSWGYSHVTVTIQANNSVDIAALANWWGQELVTFEAIDPLGAFVEDTIIVTVIPVNDPPVLAPLPPLVVHYDYNYSFDLTPYLSDPDTPIEDLSVGTSNPNNVTVQGRVLTLLFPQRLGALTAPYLVPLTVTVSDGLNSVFQSTSVSVTDDFPPALNRTLPDVTFAEDTRAVYPRTFDLDDYFVDGDSPPPVYSYYGNQNVSVTLHANHTVDFSAPVNWSGGEFVTFRATDNRSAFAADTLYVLVTPVNDAPYIYRVPAQVKDAPGSWLLDLAPYIVDSDTNVTLLIVSTGAHPRVTALGLVLLFDYSDGPRTETVTVTVSDGELTATRTIEVEVLSPNPVLPLLPWLLAAAFLATLFLWDRYLRAIVEEVFVIHRDGLLIAHLSRTLTPDKDRDTVSAMFTVVQEFVRDTFRETGETSQIDAMNIGHRKVSIRQGRAFYLAVLYRGFGASRVEAKAEAVVKQVEARFGTELEHWSGVTKDVQGIGPLLERMFRVRRANVAPDDEE